MGHNLGCARPHKKSSKQQKSFLQLLRREGQIGGKKERSTSIASTRKQNGNTNVNKTRNKEKERSVHAENVAKSQSHINVGKRAEGVHPTQLLNGN